MYHLFLDSVATPPGLFMTTLWHLRSRSVVYDHSGRGQTQLRPRWSWSNAATTTLAVVGSRKSKPRPLRSEVGVVVYDHVVESAPYDHVVES